MKTFNFDFKNCSSINQVLEKFYHYLNDLGGGTKVEYVSGYNIVWDAYYDDVFGVLSDENLIKKYGNEIHLILIGLNEFKEKEFDNYKKFLEYVMDYQVEELPKHNINFSYNIQD